VSAALLAAGLFTGSSSTPTFRGGGGIDFASEPACAEAAVLFILAALILALTLAASASRSLAASLAAILAIVSGLCCGITFSRGLGSLLELSVRSLGVETGFGAGRDCFRGDVEEDLD
jgi:hypothetical protein